LKNGDGCNSLCVKEECGNGVKDAGEECDDGNKDTGDGCNKRCELEGCGNNIVDSYEECDDGNIDNGDGCDERCQKEECGNNRLDAEEQCDDGNNKNDDGCDNNCQYETGLIILQKGAEIDEMNHIAACFNEYVADLDLTADPDNDGSAIYEEIANTQHPFQSFSPQYADADDIPTETMLAPKALVISYLSPDGKDQQIKINIGEGNFVGWYNFSGCIQGRIPAEYAGLSAKELAKKDFRYEFQPFSEITRAEALKIIFQGFNIGKPEKLISSDFKDIKKTDWFNDYVGLAEKAFIIKGFSDGNFRPNDFIRRAEALKIIMLVAGINTDHANMDYIANVFDVNSNAWYAPYVAKAMEKEIIPLDLGAFHPEEYITRYDLVKYTVIAMLAQGEVFD
jgi:cysteine-rich repeat protein